MKSQIQFSEKNKKNAINLSSAELAQRVVKVKPYSSEHLSLTSQYFRTVFNFFFYNYL